MSVDSTIRRLTKGFDVLSYVQRTAPTVPYAGRTDEFMTTCPFCHKQEHLGINVASGKWHCFRCGAKSKTLVSFIAAVEHISWRAALEMLYTGVDDGEACDVSMVTTLLETVEGLDSVEFPSTIPLPLGYISLHNRQIPYTQMRRLPQATINRQQIGYCETGTYGGYLIIPDTNPQDDVVYWIARNMHNNKPKTKNPPKDWAKVGTSDRLFNYSRAIRHSCGVLVEGWADALRVGENAVATYGTGLKGNQLGLLIQGGFEELILMYDGDVSDDVLMDIGHTLAPFFTTKIAKLEDNTDPDDYHSKQLKQLILGAKLLPNKLSNVKIHSFSKE